MKPPRTSATIRDLDELREALKRIASLQSGPQSPPARAELGRLLRALADWRERHAQVPVKPLPGGGHH